VSELPPSPVTFELPIDRHLAVAVEQFMRSVTVPILADRSGEQLAHLGTGTLFDVSGKMFLVTAKHIFDGEDLDKIAIPESPRESKVHTLGSRAIFSLDDSSDREFDIVVSRLDVDAICNSIRANWRCLSFADTSTADEHGRFVICGYPSALITERTKSGYADLVATALIFYTNRIPVPNGAQAPVDERIDLFFRHEKESKSLTGESITSPKFQGISGASVWQTFPTPAGSIWTPQSALKVVGIQSGARHGDYLRAKSWDYVRETIRRAE
jgi:hypothetical protein